MKRFLARWKWSVTLSVCVLVQLAIIARLCLGPWFGCPVWFCHFLAAVLFARLVLKLTPLFLEIWKVIRS